MWADSRDTMVTPGPERAKHLVVGGNYWMSNSLHGLRTVKVIAFDDVFAVVRVPGIDRTVRLSETSFYYEKPR